MLFVLPAALFVVSLTIIPLLLGIAIAFSDWNLSSPTGPKFAGLGNIEQMLSDPFYWNALTNMVWYSLAVLVEYAHRLRAGAAAEHARSARDASSAWPSCCR